jgi:predicted  nucleic acid-binding Zn-ribbon protein
VKVTQNQLQDLLELNAVDQLITRTKQEAVALGSNAEYLELQAQLRAKSSEFIEAKNRIDSLKLDLKRLESDAELVNKRLAKDQAALRTTSVVKDAQGLQSEIRTLEKRKAELEDQELQIMENLDEAEAAVAAVEASRAATEEQLRGVVASLEKEKLRLVSGIELAQADRKQLAGRIPAELLAIYDNKAKRGVPVARLIHAECKGCRMNLSATNLAEILKKPSDELVYCPDCFTILVR